MLWEATRKYLGFSPQAEGPDEIELFNQLAGVLGGWWFWWD